MRETSGRGEDIPGGAEPKKSPLEGTAALRTLLFAIMILFAMFVLVSATSEGAKVRLHTSVDAVVVVEDWRWHGKVCLLIG